MIRWRSWWVRKGLVIVKHQRRERKGPKTWDASVEKREREAEKRRVLRGGKERKSLKKGQVRLPRRRSGNNCEEKKGFPRDGKEAQG